jgi:hypothetical protein
VCADVEAAACDRPPGNPLTVHWYFGTVSGTYRCNIDGEIL